jgi:hypothetical protein
MAMEPGRSAPQVAAGDRTREACAADNGEDDESYGPGSGARRTRVTTLTGVRKPFRPIIGGES